MASLHKLEKELLSDGRITVDDVGRIEQIESDGNLTMTTKFFFDPLANASEVCEFITVFSRHAVSSVGGRGNRHGRTVSLAPNAVFRRCGSGL